MTARLHHLALRGYRSLRSVELTLGDLTVLIGPNGAGKSNLLDAFRFLNALRRGALRSFVGQAGGASTLLHRHAKTSDSIDLQLNYSGPSSDGFDVTGYIVKLRPTQDDGLIIDFEWIDLQPQGPPPDALTMPGGRGARESDLLDETRPDGPRALAFPAFSIFHFHDTSPGAPLRTPARAGDDQQLREDGANLAAVLHRLRASEAADERVA
jgi:predicted ATPase